MRRYDNRRSMEHERPAPRQHAPLSLMEGGPAVRDAPLGRATLMVSALAPVLLAALADPAVALAAALPAAALSRLA